jgi:hypothetical protein
MIALSYVGAVAEAVPQIITPEIDGRSGLSNKNTDMDGRCKRLI